MRRYVSVVSDRHLPLFVTRRPPWNNRQRNGRSSQTLRYVIRHATLCAVSFAVVETDSVHRTQMLGLRLPLLLIRAHGRFLRANSFRTVKRVISQGNVFCQFLFATSVAFMSLQIWCDQMSKKRLLTNKRLLGLRCSTWADVQAQAVVMTELVQFFKFVKFCQ